VYCIKRWVAEDIIIQYRMPISPTREHGLAKDKQSVWCSGSRRVLSRESLIVPNLLSVIPAWLNATTLLFTSTRPEDSTAKTKVYTNRVYQAVYTEGSLADSKKTVLPQAKDIHLGVVCVTPDGNTIFLTRWSLAGNKKTSTIYTSNKKGDSWSDPVLLSELANSPGANTQQPFVTSDGKYLLFASDRSGGHAWFDIWYAELDADGKPGSP
jgi:OmpA-OmpF porin, OOP family